jgi:hypothetical protein
MVTAIDESGNGEGGATRMATAADESERHHERAPG